MTLTGPRSNWMLYGAYGLTGRLILDEALSRGQRPVLAGRDGERLAALGRSTGLPTRRLALEDGAAVRAALSDVRCVLLAAGPYGSTGPAMRRACLDARCSYLDINSELADFCDAMTLDADARRAGIGIVAGVGYGVVFAECLAAHLKARMPSATSVRLSLATQTVGRSRGATLSAADALTAGGYDMYRGTLRPRPIASPTWEVRTADRTAVRFAAAPRAELVAVHRSTGIADVTIGIPLSRVAIAGLRVAGPLLGKVLARIAARTSPSAPAAVEAARDDGMRSRIWAHAEDDSGRRAAALLESGEGYRAAAQAAVRAVELQVRDHHAGALTPGQAFGTDFALLIPDTRIQEL
jgi:short subunit dehydrogenase-like uncharacterized protein